MRLHRARGQEEPLGDVGVAEAVGDQGEHVHLPAGHPGRPQRGGHRCGASAAAGRRPGAAEEVTAGAGELVVAEALVLGEVGPQRADGVDPRGPAVGQRRVQDQHPQQPVPPRRVGADAAPVGVVGGRLLHRTGAARGHRVRVGQRGLVHPSSTRTAAGELSGRIVVAAHRAQQHPQAQVRQRRRGRVLQQCLHAGSHQCVGAREVARQQRRERPHQRHVRGHIGRTVGLGERGVQEPLRGGPVTHGRVDGRQDHLHRGLQGAQPERARQLDARLGHRLGRGGPVRGQDAVGEDQVDARHVGQHARLDGQLPWVGQERGSPAAFELREQPPSELGVHPLLEEPVLGGDRGGPPERRRGRGQVAVLLGAARHQLQRLAQRLDGTGPLGDGDRRRGEHPGLRHVTGAERGVGRQQRRARILGTARPVHVGQRPLPLPGAHGGPGQPQAQLGVRVAGRRGQCALPRLQRVRGPADPGQQHHPVGRGLDGVRGGHPVQQRFRAAQRPAREVPAGGPEQERRRPPVLACTGQQRRGPHVVVRAAAGEQRVGRPARHGRPFGGQRGGRHRLAGERVPPPQLAVAHDQQTCVRRCPQPRRHHGLRPVRDLRQQRPRRLGAEHGRGPQHRGRVVVDVRQPLLDQCGERGRHSRTVLPRQLLDQQRQPVGGGDHPVQAVGGQVRRVGGGQRRGLRRREPLRPQHHGARQPAERGAARAVVPGGDDHEQPRRARAVRQVLDERDGVGVRPMQILQRQQAAAAAASGRSSRSTPSPSTTVGSAPSAASGSPGVHAGSSLRRAGRNGRSSSSAGDRSRRCSANAAATARYAPPPATARPVSTAMPAARARATATASSRDFPMPASPSTTTAAPVPRAARSTAERSAVSSARRPTRPPSAASSGPTRRARRSARGSR